MSLLTVSLAWIARVVLRTLGWRLAELPENLPSKFIGILGHHTSHWDLAIGMLGYWAYDIRFGILVKKEVFEIPLLGALVRALGGIPVDRENPSTLMADCVAALRSSPIQAIVLAPSGTRSRRPGWKMGFYSMARRAGCPVMLNYLDWDTRQCGLGLPLELSGNVHEDMGRIRWFYADKAPKFPERATPIRPLPARTQS